MRPGWSADIQSLPDAATLYMPVVAQAELLAGVELAVSETYSSNKTVAPMRLAEGNA